jgi:dinuclear metal center YbgI/SA1388 family protein
MTPVVSDILEIIEDLAPPFLAEEWDNCGLQVGDPDRPVKHVRIALDPTPEVVAAACADKVDLLVTHHPLIFRPLRSIDFKSPVGKAIRSAAVHDLAIYSAHTNLDAAANGLNDILADRIGLKGLSVLGSEKGPDLLKLVVYAPSGSEDAILSRLGEAGAGRIGAYSGCTFRSSGKGTFKPEAGAAPVIGKIGESVETDEVRIETVVAKSDLARIIRDVRASHPYETMAYDVYPLLMPGAGAGLGRIGELEAECTLSAFAEKIREKLGLTALKFAGAPDLSVVRVAICAGSGSSLMSRFVASGAQVYISGDLRYHDARLAEECGLGLIDIGHFASELPVVASLAVRLRRAFSEAGMAVVVEASTRETDPFTLISDPNK